MLASFLNRYLRIPYLKTGNSNRRFWLSLSLTIALIYSLLALKQAFSSEYVVQDDARQHVFWMLRFIDPALFPNDLIADYFQSVAPAGYSFIYQSAAQLGINPLVFNKLLPLFLDLVTTFYCFEVAVEMLPVPITGFLASLLLNHYLWLRDDLISATPAAFVYPFFLAFLYYLLRRFLIPCLSAIALLGLFYPQAVLICAGILFLQLPSLKKFFPRGLRTQQTAHICWSGLIVAAIVLSIYALKSSAYGPVVTAAEAKTMPEFLSGGTSQFFVDNFWEFWLDGKRSGLMPQFAGVVLAVAGGLFPWIILFPSYFPLRKRVTPHVSLLFQTTLASLAIFSIAHVLLFRLHLPNRYTEHSLRIVTALAAAIALTVMLDAVLNWIEQSRIYHQTLKIQHYFVLGLTIIALAALPVYPFAFEEFPDTNYIIGQAPSLYKFLSQQPKDSLIASLAQEASNLPVFARRSLLVGSEGYPVPYHQGYYQFIRQRTLDLISAQYSPNLAQVQQFVQKYSIDFWLLERDYNQSEYLEDNPWIRQYKPAANQAIAQLAAGKEPVLTDWLADCSVFENEQFMVLKGSCLLKVKSKGEF